MRAGLGPTMSKRKSQPRTDWSEVADWYDQHVGDAGDEYHQAVVLPGALRLLALQPHQRAIDVACGQGVLCRLLAKHNIEATGIDAAQAMIEVALRRGPENIRYQVGDASDAGGLPSEHFHGAACILAIQNIQPLPP